MFVLILVGIVLFLIHPAAGWIYTAVILFAIEMVMINKAKKKKTN